MPTHGSRITESITPQPIKSIADSTQAIFPDSTRTSPVVPEQSVVSSSSTDIPANESNETEKSVKKVEPEVKPEPLHETTKFPTQENFPFEKFKPMDSSVSQTICDTEKMKTSPEGEQTNLYNDIPQPKVTEMTREDVKREPMSENTEQIPAVSEMSKIHERTSSERYREMVADKLVERKHRKDEKNIIPEVSSKSDTIPVKSEHLVDGEATSESRKHESVSNMKSKTSVSNKKPEYEPELSKWEREDYESPTSKSPTAAPTTRPKKTLPK